MPELSSIVTQKESSKIIFSMKLLITTISPSFCIIFFLLPKEIKNNGFEVIIILSITINVIIISFLYQLFSKQINVINKIQVGVDTKGKKECINMLSREILTHISNIIITVSIIIIVGGLMLKNSCINDVFNKVIVSMFFLGVIGYMFVWVNVYKEEAEKLQQKLKYYKFIEEDNDKI